MSDHIERQNADGTWSEAQPIKMPWYVRLEVWIRRHI